LTREALLVIGDVLGRQLIDEIRVAVGDHLVVEALDQP
jgi:hypothetical protein